ncbi:MAG TPA: ATP-binding protein [Humidesulfovibrio sp.]|uniref:ATP-binding protein n=1 Tax=Humidesulfovibrio sp. TaxID=2910988 RepID=UPI002BDA9CEC|nr:ATP-binding protein [Humidesulfovibrio sp.]HWR05139.1 ATP-binding protein [Humidesulfovibrio sp.]
MSSTAPTAQSRHSFLRFSPWLLVGLALILGLVIAVLAVRNAQREKQHMSQSLMARAESLIWALEAGSRAWMGMGGGGNLQTLLQETAKQPDVVFMMVTDRSGIVLAHSDPEKVGLRRVAEGEGTEPDAAKSPMWRLIDDPGTGKVFEVYKVFAPLPGLGHEMWHRGSQDGCDGQAPGTGRRGGMGMGMGMGMGRTGAPAPAATRAGEQIVYVGLDVRPFEAALDEDFRNTVVTALLAGLLGFGGFVSLFWAQSHRRTRRLLQDARALASEVITSLPLGLLTTDPEGRVALANETASALLGAGQLSGKPLETAGGLPWAAYAAELAQGRPVLEREAELADASGARAPVSLSASRIVNEEGLFLGNLFILRDLREIKRLQEQVRRSERLSALGNLAAGIAHEIRNPLSSIKGFATFLAAKVQGEGPEKEAGKEAAKIMIQEVDRLNRVVSELLEFARPGQPVLKPGDVNMVINQALRLCGSDAAARGVDVRFEPGVSLPPIPLDAERLTQALLNLFLNAIQAMDKGGALTVSARVEGDPARLALRVADTGTGMSPEVLASIFNPYFTTRPTGTGLGLAIVHRVVEGHGGEIKVESQPGAGTAFTMLLPLAERNGEEA